MEFDEKELKEIKGDVSELKGYTELLKEKYKGDIEDILNRDIKIFTFTQGSTVRFVMTHNQQQIGECKAIINHEDKTFFMSSVAILPNLQKKGIGNDFFKKVFIPFFTKEYEEYSLTTSPKQTELGKKYVASRQR